MTKMLIIDYFFRLLIPIFDTWFGVAVHTAIITQLTNTSAAEWHTFGRHLNSDYVDGRVSQTACAEAPGIPASQDGNSQPFW